VLYKYHNSEKKAYYCKIFEIIGAEVIFIVQFI
jgi:hypothetical protein